MTTTTGMAEHEARERNGWIMDSYLLRKEGVAGA